VSEQRGEMNPLRRWFFEIWPFDNERHEVMRGYVALGQSKHTLTDIAQRNHVFSPAPPADNLYAAGIAEGRRQCALELIKLASEEPQRLFQFVSRPPNRGEKS
jgi:hypothetical protein